MADIQRQIADRARPLAEVGDRIEHGQPIPANVVRMLDTVKDPWDRVDGVPTQSFRYYDDDPCTVEDLRSMKRWWPMTVVEVDPEPQPAEPCDECEGDGVNCWEHGGRERSWGKPAAPSGPQVFEVPQPPPGESALAATVEHLGMAVGALTSARRRITGDYVDPYRKLDPLAPLDDGIERIKDAKALLTGDASAASRPVVLRLPEVPEGAVALVTEDGTRFVRHGPGWWQSNHRGTMSLARILTESDGVTVELAPPREPRTWPKLDVEPQIDDLPRTVDVEDHGRWSRLATHYFYPEANPNGAPRTLAGLRELGQVREVLR